MHPANHVRGQLRRALNSANARGPPKGPQTRSSEASHRRLRRSRDENTRCLVGSSRLSGVRSASLSGRQERLRTSTKWSIQRSNRRWPSLRKTVQSVGSRGEEKIVLRRGVLCGHDQSFSFTYRSTASTIICRCNGTSSLSHRSISKTAFHV